MKDYGLMNGDAILTLAIKLTEDMKENIRKEEEESVL